MSGVPGEVASIRAGHRCLQAVGGVVAQNRLGTALRTCGRQITGRVKDAANGRAKSQTSMWCGRCTPGARKGPMTS